MALRKPRRAFLHYHANNKFGREEIPPRKCLRGNYLRIKLADCVVFGIASAPIEISALAPCISSRLAERMMSLSFYGNCRVPPRVIHAHTEERCHRASAKIWCYLLLIVFLCQLKGAIFATCLQKDYYSALHLPLSMRLKVKECVQLNC